MVSIKDVADVIKMLGEVIKSTREIIDAVNDGKKFLAQKHPQAQEDFRSLINQMQKAIEGMARITSVLTSFRFTTELNPTDYTTANSELTRFNNYVIAQRSDITALRNDIRSLKANCEKVRQLRDKLDGQTTDRSWGSLFGLLGSKAKQRTTELHDAISNFYADDQRMIDLINKTLDLAEQAIKDIDEILGPPGTANPYNVPIAAETMGTYSVLFSGPNKELNRLADIMSEAQTALIT
jgi:chromosome segregation ATPase